VVEGIGEEGPRETRASLFHLVDRVDPIRHGAAG
jgi:hypothetical protein